MKCIASRHAIEQHAADTTLAIRDSEIRVSIGTRCIISAILPQTLRRYRRSQLPRRLPTVLHFSGFFASDDEARFRKHDYVPVKGILPENNRQKLAVSYMLQFRDDDSPRFLIQSFVIPAWIQSRQFRGHSIVLP